MSDLLNTKELAERLKIHPETVRRMVNREQIPFIKISDREFRFDFDKVMLALENGVNND